MNSSNNHPDVLKIKYNCFTLTLFNEISFKDNKIHFKDFFSTEDNVPDTKAWKKFWSELENLDIWHWKKEYNNYTVLDGCDWSIKISHNGKTIKSEGSNQWPENFKGFIKALKDLTGFDVTKKESFQEIDLESEKYIQSAITAIAFPRDLDGLVKQIWKNQDLPIDYHTDMDLLLYHEDVFKYIEDNNEEPYNWSAPRWMSKGDILFFYHSKSSQYSSKKVFKELEEYEANEIVIKNALHGLELAKKYAGKIIGFGEIAGPTEYFGFQDQHFKDRTFAPIESVHIFENPIDIEIFSNFIKISPGGTNTPISRDKDFQQLKEVLSENNVLPDYLKTAKIGNNTFRNVNKDNWREISCSINSSFLYEDQIRSYLIDYFLKEIKDNRTPLLEECDCFRDSKKTGTSDYFIKINSIWVPVEAKVNILSEKDIRHQLSKYLHIDSFRPTIRNQEQKEFDAFNPKFALIIDQSGVYIYNDNEFIDCKPGEPIWVRKDMPETDKIRKNIISYLDEFY